MVKFNAGNTDTLEMRPCIPISDLRQLFAVRKFRNFFHANAVETGLSFFSMDALTSRAQVEAQRLPQSPQYTDAVDKKYGVFDDIWLNFADFHRNFGRPNEYGPLTFRLPLLHVLNFLESKPSAKVSITKGNADKWKDTDQESDRWFKDISEFESAFRYGREHEHNTYFNRVIPDFVVSGLPQGLPLSLCDTVLVEKNPELTRLLDDLKSAASKLAVSYLKRGQTINWRHSCKETCTCVFVQSFLKANILAKFKFGAWQKLVGHDAYENWSKGRSA